MTKYFILKGFVALFLLVIPINCQIFLHGSGASFPSSLINNWGSSFSARSPNPVVIVYNASDSATGVDSLRQQSNLFNFAATDIPLSNTQISQFPASVLNFPEALGAVVLSYNFPNNEIAGTLNLTATIIAGIFQGNITSWSDPAIKAINPGLTSTAPILVVVRGDASGTTYALTDYLSSAAASWTMGKSNQPTWPAGFEAEYGNQGVAAEIQATSHSIGYVQYGYARSLNLPCALIQNMAGNFVAVTDAGVVAATSSVINQLPGINQSWMSVSIVNQPGATTYPISTFTYLVAYQDDTVSGVAGAALVAFFKYALSVKGQSLVSTNYLVALPESLRQRLYTSLSMFTVSGNPNSFLPAQVYTLASLFPISNPNNSIALELNSAFRIACEAANLTFSSSLVSIQCVSVTSAANAASSGAIGVVGDIQSSDTMSEAPILANANISQISPASTDVSLSSKTNFPYFLRTVTPDNYQAPALVNIIQSYGWKQVAIISSTSTYAQSVTSGFTSLCASSNITILTSQTFTAGVQSPSSLTQQMQAIANSGATIVIVSAIYSELSVVMNAAAQNNLASTGTAWISIIGGNPMGVDFSASQGVISLNPKSGTGKLFESLKALWLTKDPSQYPGTIFTPTQGSTPDPIMFTGQTFDAVYTFVRAIDQLTSVGGDPSNGPALLSALRTVTFLGTTGTISFTGNDISTPSFTLDNILGNQLNYVGVVYTNTKFSAEKMIVWPGSTVSNPTGKRNLIYNLGGVFATSPVLIDSNPILYDLSIELQTAYRIACEVANTNIMKSAKLNCLWQSTAFDRNSTVLAANILANQSVVGIVGSIYSETADALAQYVSTPLQIPQISPSAAALQFSNKTLYPYFLRLSPNELNQVMAVNKLMTYFGWQKVATLGVGSSYYQNTVSLFISQCKANNIQVLASQSLSGTSDISQVVSALNVIKNSGARIIFLNAFIQDALIIFEQAALLSMTTTGWGWIGSPQTTLETARAFDGHAAAETAMVGMISIRPQGGTGAIYDTLIADWKSRDPIQYPGLLQLGYPAPITWSPETFDSVFAFAYAIEATLANGGDPTNGQTLIAALRADNFTGSTGSCAFDVNGDPFKPVFDLVNFRDGMFTPVGQYVLGGVNATFQRTGTIVWPGGDLNVPKDSPTPPAPTPKPATASTGSSLSAAVLVLILILAIIAVLAILVIIWIWRRERRTGKGFFTSFKRFNDEELVQR